MSDQVPFPNLFAPLHIGDMELRNRIVSTGHQTCLAQDHLPGDALIAYHEARARGGAGLIITESARFHSSSFSSAPELRIVDDAAVPYYARLAQAVQGHGARIIGQLSHSGRVSSRMQNGLRGVTYAPSNVASQRHHAMPRAMSDHMIAELVESVGAAARRYSDAGFDGLELLASHGLLFGQFLNPSVNRRGAPYGGTFENRIRFLLESLDLSRRSMRPGMILGLRISADEFEQDGLEQDEILSIVQHLSYLNAVDYLNVTVGSMAGLGGSIHVVPPMEVPSAYVAPLSERLRRASGLPVLVAGRINQPQEAEMILARGQADLCGMTRAMITDPDIAEKSRNGKLEEIRACIGCNQACIGHLHKGVGISCIQTPLSGREAVLAPRLSRARGLQQRVLVVGGGPAGMRAAITAAERGHKVMLVEATPSLGGQARLAQLLPERSEFGGLITSMQIELATAGVEVRLGNPVTRAMIEVVKPDVVVLGTGARPAPPEIEIAGSKAPIPAEEVIAGNFRLGGRVVVADGRADWVAIGTAAMLAQAGHYVRLAVDGLCAGQNLPTYVRDYWAGRLHTLGVAVVPYVSLFGMDEDTVYFTHSTSGKAQMLEGMDDVVYARHGVPNTELEQAIEGLGLRMLLVGDCLSPRTAEEAVFEGFNAGLDI